MFFFCPPESGLFLEKFAKWRRKRIKTTSWQKTAKKRRGGYGLKKHGKDKTKRRVLYVGK